MTAIQPKTALISVANKQGLDQLASALTKLGIQIYATGGTAHYLLQLSIPVTGLETITDHPEMLDGRVKTLQSAIHAGILADRNQHSEELDQYQWPAFDMVVCNLYPFEAQAQTSKDMKALTEYIDIGGPAMLRAAAKNHAFVIPVCDPNDYGWLLEQLNTRGGLSAHQSQHLAHKVFRHTAHYDTVISQTLASDKTLDKIPAELTQTWIQKAVLRYGENPHQWAALYQAPTAQFDWFDSQIQGKALSYNNLLDAHAALAMLREYSKPACIVVKHGNACGAAVSETIEQAFQNAWAGDPQSAFGSVIALNRHCNKETAHYLHQHFIEVVLAPSFDEQALAILNHKANLRLLALGEAIDHQNVHFDYHYMDDHLLVQQTDQQIFPIKTLRCVTETPMNQAHLASASFGWPVLKHLDANAVMFCLDQQAIGIGSGCVARIDALKIAMEKAQSHDLSNAVLLSDGFFPFRDAIDYIAWTGIKAVIQPGGSKRDQRVIDACNEYNIAMAFTDQRCFSH